MSHGVELLHDRLLIQVETNETQSQGGILFPVQYYTGVNARHQKGTVMAVGPGLTRMDGTFVPTEIKPGDRVLFEPDSGVTATVLGEDLVVIPESKVIGILEEV